MEFYDFPYELGMESSSQLTKYDEVHHIFQRGSFKPPTSDLLEIPIWIKILIYQDLAT